MTHRDIVWLTLESVRQDHTSLGGNDRNTTPFLTQIASESQGSWSDKCFSHDIWTRPSSTSILTGLPSSAHHVRHDEAKLSETIETIPDQLNRQGYNTVGLSPIAQFSQATGLARGFDDFYYLNSGTIREEVDITTLVKFLVNIRRHSAGITRDMKKHCSGYLMSQIAKQHIRSAVDDGPLFLYAHLGDSHHVYWPPKTWQSRYADELDVSIDTALDIAMDMSDRLHEHIAHGASFSDREWEALRAMYDTLIAYVDHLAADIVEYARSHLDDPIIVITADHGELFGEHGLLAHLLVTNTAVSNVPLVVYGLNDQFEPDTLVQHADVWTMLNNDLNVDIESPAGQDIREKQRDYVVTQRGGKRARKNLDEIEKYDSGFDRSRFHEDDLTSIRTKTHRYQRSNESSELFSVADETVEISGQEPEVARELANELDAWLSEYDREDDVAESAEFDQAMSQQLRDLGYL